MSRTRQLAVEPDRAEPSLLSSSPMMSGAWGSMMSFNPQMGNAASQDWMFGSSMMPSIFQPTNQCIAPTANSFTPTATSAANTGATATSTATTTPTSNDWEKRARGRIADENETAWLGSINASSDRLKDQGYKNSSGAFVGALLDAEAAKDKKGQWKADSFNADSNAGGLTQFLPGTWTAMANKQGSYLNEQVSTQNAQRKAAGKAPLTAAEIQQLRFDPDISIHTAADYAVENLSSKSYGSRIKKDAGVADVKDLQDRDLYYYAYLAHHEGAGGASTFLDVKGGALDPSKAKTQEDKDAAKKKLDSFLSNGKWSSNVPAKERWEQLKAAGMSEDKLPEDVRKQLAATTDQKAKDKVLGEYASKVDKSNLDNQAIFAKAYTGYLDGYIKKQQTTWFGKPGAAATGGAATGGAATPGAATTTATSNPKTTTAVQPAAVTQQAAANANVAPADAALAATMQASVAGPVAANSIPGVSTTANNLAAVTADPATAVDNKAATPETKADEKKLAETYFEPEKTPTREKFITDYKSHLTDRMAEIQKLPAAERNQRIESLLKQVEDVSGRLNNGKFTDLSKLNTAPNGGAGDPVENGFVPPELIASLRPFIKMTETEQAGQTVSADRQAEGSLYSKQDWNSRLGVPQYRTQSDNLASPEATCNVTSFSMALERLGYKRADVESAVERELKNKYLREQKRDPAKEDLSKVELPPEYYGEAVKKYLDKNNGSNLKNYQKLRSRGTTDEERKAYAKDFKDNSQMEDSLDFLLHLSNVDRTTINGNAAKILGKIEPDPAKRPEVVTRQITNKYSYDDMKKEMGTTLEGGGAAMMSVYHKGAGQTGTHIVSVQNADKTGVVMDDPYGQMRETYRRNKTGDAYAKPGDTRAGSGLMNKKHNGATGTDKDDWKIGAAQGLTADESRGESNHRSDEQVKGMMNYATFFRRPAAKKEEKKAS